MADQKLSELTQITGASVSSANDELYIRDVSEVSVSQSKAITVDELLIAQGADIFEIPFHLDESGGLSAKAWPVTESAFFPFDVVSFVGRVDTGGGNITAKINGTAVSGISSAVLTSAQSTKTAGVSSNSVTSTDGLELQVSGVSGGATVISGGFKCKRV